MKIKDLVKSDSSLNKKLKHCAVKSSECNFHKVSFDELKAKFCTSLENGLDPMVSQQLFLKFGPNQIKVHKQNIFLKLLKYFFTGFCSLLWISSLICILAWKPIGNPPDPTNVGLGILLIVVILLQAAFSAFQDWSSGKVMKSIRNMMPSQAAVIRNGVEHKIPIEELVIGDLVLLCYGNKVPADIRIIESHDLKFDKSLLTGESDAIEGTVHCTDESFVESQNIAFMTTLITNGQGKGIVVATGDQTMMGKIAGLTNETCEKETSLQRELKRFVFIIGTAATITAITVVLVWYFWLRVQYPNYIDMASIMVNTISVMIAFIPEGLPVCVTLSLLMIAKKMAKSKVLVKNLATIETLSCVNVIASDKTGTLTQNKMFVGNALAGLENLKLHNSIKEGLANKQLVAAASLCNNAHFEEDVNNHHHCCANNPNNVEKSKLQKNMDIATRKAIGDATDIALLRFATQHGEFDNLPSMYAEICEIPFNSKNKWMMKVVRPKEQNVHNVLFGFESSSQSNLMLIKGAPDILMKNCNRILQTDGSEIELTESIMNEITRTQNEWCMLGQRVIVLCKRESQDFDTNLLSTTSEQEAFVNRCKDFCIIGMLGIIDPPRTGISEVIARCREAGIRVLMVTGDYALTAAAIANEIGIFTSHQKFDTIVNIHEKYKGSKVEESKENLVHSRMLKDSYTSLLLNGCELASLNKEEWRIITKYDEVVFARTTPEQKLLIVKEFQRDKYVVGVTGDGVNDAPALKSADIGIAMGSGSEVAMEASQLVLLDNNFSSILIAIRNGRLVFDNLRKVILYLLPGGCVAELIPVLMYIFLGVPQALSSFQMLIISLFTDIAPSLSLMMEKAEVDLLKQPPRSRNAHLVDWKFILHAYFFLGIIISFFSQCMFYLYLYIYHNLLPSDLFFDFGYWADGYKGLDQLRLQEIIQTGQTVTFVSLVIMQIFGNLLSTRTHIRSFFQSIPFLKPTRNMAIFGAQLTSITIMLVVVFVPFFNRVFGTRPIPLEFFMLPIVCCILIFSLDELRKLFVRKRFLFFHRIGW